MTGHPWTIPPHLAEAEPEPTRDGLADADQAAEFIERFHAEHPDAGPAAPGSAGCALRSS
ncbi:hypothetical protein ACFQV2_23830 [Actinokineospora soli]|uniref:Uncharacterized protein n=1 Tax=Actinokineospora soli TaxID=1048753 RepID=A0ABW2TT21_9PSEU